MVYTDGVHLIADSLSELHSFAGILYFMVYSVESTFKKILEVNKKLSIEELEKYLKAELSGLIDIEYMEILNFFKIQLGIKV